MFAISSLGCVEGEGHVQDDNRICYRHLKAQGGHLSPPQGDSSVPGGTVQEGKWAG